MSHSHGHFFFGNDNICETTQQYLSRYLNTLSILETIITNYHLVDILSLEEVTPESYEVLYPMISKYYHLYISEIFSPSGLGTLLVTGFNKTIFPIKTVIQDLTEDFQQFYNVNNSKNYPCRSQIFQINLYNKEFIYSHLHAPGIPDDSIKNTYFSKVKEFILTIGENKFHIICGDFNEDRLDFLKNIFENRFEIIYDERPTSYHRFTKNNSGEYSENEIQYKKVDHLMISSGLFIESYQVVYNSTYGLGNHLSGVRGDGNVNPYYKLQDIWYPHMNSLGYIWPSDHALNIYNIIVPYFSEKSNLQGGSSKNDNDLLVGKNILEQFNRYYHLLTQFNIIYDDEDSATITEEDLIKIFEVFKIVDLKILERNYKYDNISNLKKAFSKDSISEIIVEYLYELDVFYSEPFYQQLYLNYEYDQLKIDIVTTCHQKIKEIFGTENFTKNDIEIIKQFNSGNHGVEYPVLLLEIRGQKIVFKPRPALIDQSVIKLFSDINNVNPYDFFNLPEYKIVNCGKMSFWEYIEGGSVYNSGIISLLQTVDNLNKSRNLSMLNTVATRIGLTDLHSQNIIINGDMYIPIDLEVIKKGNDSGLYMNDSNVVIRGVILNLIPEIDDLINEFNDNVHNIPRRILPISTTILKDFIENNTVAIDELVDIFKHNIPNWDKQGVDESKLKEYFINCKQSKIIPYFIIQNGKILMKSRNN